MLSRITLTFALAYGVAVPALADDAEDQALGTIVVTGNPSDYVGIGSSTALGTDTALLDTPQTINVLTRERLDDQALLTIVDALRYVPGVTVGQGEGHRDQPTIRGNNTTADFFLDGLRDDVQYFRDFYNVERLEILKGPNALTFGRGGGGGVINRVTKTPGGERFAAFDAAIDTDGSTRIGVDLNQPLTATIAARLNAFYERAENHRDFYEAERFGINPTIAVQIGDRGTIGASYEYLNDDRVIDRGIPSAGGRPLAGFRDTFFGDPAINSSRLEAHIASLYGSYALTDALTLKSRILYGNYDKAYRNVFPTTAVINGSLGIEAYSDTTERRNLLSQTDLVWTVATGSIGHVILAGVELGHQKTENERINGFFSATTNTLRVNVALSDPIVVPPVFLRSGPGNRLVETKADTLGVYIQDQISIGEQFEIVAGIRYDRFEVDFSNKLAATGFSRTDALWSPRLGLIFKPIPAASLYASYSRSYLPQSGDQFLSLDATTSTLAPERFENYEIGAKWDITPRLNLTAALYRLDRTNSRAAGPVAGTIVLTGEQRSKGVELNLQGEITDNWQASLGYALQDAEIRSTTTAAPAGRKVAQVPRHQVALWNRVDISDRFGVGVGVVHQSRSFASISNAVALPAYTRVDAAVFVSLGNGFEAQANIENLFDEGYFPTAHNDNNITTGRPTSARFTVRKRF